MGRAEAPEMPFLAAVDRGVVAPPGEAANDELRGEWALAEAHAVQGSGQVQIYPWDPFPVKLLPEPLQRIVIGAANSMGCDESYVAVPLLSVLAGVIGNSRVARLEEGWDEPAVLWTAIVGESGTLKSPALDLVLRPLQRRQEEAFLAHERALEEYDVRKAIQKAEFSAWRKRCRDGESEEQFIEANKHSIVWLNALLSLPDGSELIDRLLEASPQLGGLLSEFVPRIPKRGDSEMGDGTDPHSVAAGLPTARHEPDAGHDGRPVAGGTAGSGDQHGTAENQHRVGGNSRQTIWEPPPVLERPPVCRQHFVSDATIEELAVLLSENPRGLLVARDELSGWLTHFDSRRGRKGNNMAHWLTIFRSLPLVYQCSRGNHRRLYVPRPTVSVTGGIQPDVLKTVRAQVRNGLLPRLLLVYPPVRDRPWVRRALDPALDRELEGLIAKLEQLEPDRGPRGTVLPLAVRLTKEAEREWTGFYRNWATRRASSTGDLAAAFSKAECYGARLALVIHLVRAATGAAAPDAIDRHSMYCGQSLARWFTKESHRIYDRLDGVCHSNDRNELIEWIRNRGGVVSVTELMRGPREYRTAGAAEAALRALAQYGLGTIHIRKTKGRPGIEFRFSPPAPAN